jgi:uncharacterized protein DUF6644
MSLFELCQWIQDTQVGTAIRESILVYPIILSVHVLALSVSVGTIVWFDLRLLGVKMRSQRVSDVYKQLMPWTLAGFFVMFVSGGFLFWALAAKCYGNVYFRIKLVALLLAGLNALVYHLMTVRTIADWDEAPLPPVRARMAGVLSIVLWAVVIGAGRRIVLAL